MRLKIKRLLPLMFTSVLFSCQQNEVGNESDVASVDVRELNLQSFSYEDVCDLLGSNQSVSNLRLKDGDLVKDVKVLSLATGFELINDGDEGHGQTHFFGGATEDSLAVIVNDAYASVKFTKGGQEYGYLAFADTEETEKVLDLYKGEAQTRSVSSSSVTRGVKGTSIKLNLTALAHQEEGSEYGCDSELESLETPVGEESDETPSTRASYTQWPRGNTLTIHLIRDAYDSPWEHEIDWQVNDMMTSIRDVRSDINIKVRRSSLGWKSSDPTWSSVVLTEFANYCRSGSFAYKEAAGHDIFVLVRHFGYRNNYVGRANLDTYKLSRYDNYWAYGVAATSAIYRTCLAHEVGHILGADHVSPTKWWEFWRYDDLMCPALSSKTVNRHMNYNNRNKVWNNLH